MKKKKMYPPFCVHWYQSSFTDFPLSSEWFDCLDAAIACALDKHKDYIFRIGYWDSDKLGKRYFHLEEMEVQVCLFKMDYKKHIVDICGRKHVYS